MQKRNSAAAPTELDTRKQQIAAAVNIRQLLDNPEKYEGSSAPQYRYNAWSILLEHTTARLYPTLWTGKGEVLLCRFVADYDREPQSESLPFTNTDLDWITYFPGESYDVLQPIPVTVQPLDARDEIEAAFKEGNIAWVR